MENEVFKQQRRIDKLLSPLVGKSGPALAEMRKEIEKSVLVRQLKSQVPKLALASRCLCSSHGRCPYSRNKYTPLHLTCSHRCCSPAVVSNGSDMWTLFGITLEDVRYKECLHLTAARIIGLFPFRNILTA